MASFNPGTTRRCIVPVMQLICSGCLYVYSSAATSCMRVAPHATVYERWLCRTYQAREADLICPSTSNNLQADAYRTGQLPLSGSLKLLLLYRYHPAAHHGLRLCVAGADRRLDAARIHGHSVLLLLHGKEGAQATVGKDHLQQSVRIHHHAMHVRALVMCLVLDYSNPCAAAPACQPALPRTCASCACALCVFAPYAIARSSTRAPGMQS